MISFISLFLGLVVGSQPVAVQVADSVAGVEIRLDGALATTLEGPPWRGEVDLGRDLVPHELVAVAFDRSGNELDRVSQYLNMPRQPAEITILLEVDRDSGDSVARLSWVSLTGEEPTEVRAIFDGRPVAVEDARSIPLPAWDAAVLHFLRVEMEFADFLGASAEITFGGTWADTINTELTAFPVVVDRRRGDVDAEAAAGLFRTPDRELRVAAVEKGQAELLIVRDRGAWDRLQQIRNLAYIDRSSFNPYGRQTVGDPAWFRPDRQGWESWAFQLSWSVSRRLDVAKHPYDLFPYSQKLSGAAGSLHGWVVTVEQPPDYEGRQRLADAVAIAGVTAAGSNRRRGVLVVLGDEPEDASEIAPQVARHYLDSLGVPLFVWTVAPESTAFSRWGDAVDVTTPTRMQRASTEIFRELERQRIVWLDGIHLPHEITIAGAARGLRAATDH